MKKLIAITGMDGTGKSTLVDFLCEWDQNAHEVSIWDPMKNGLFQSKKEIDKYLCSLSANARVQFLSHALTEALAMGMKTNKDTLLLNGYYYKYFASELALGASPTLVNSLIASFPVPELVICLQVDNEQAAQRKEKYSGYECGLKTPSQQHFMQFQSATHKEWELFDQSNWIKIETDQDKETVVAQVQKVITDKWS